MTHRRLELPELSLVLLIGASGSGKSTFARRHFRPTEVLSSDAFRALVADDENDQSATPDAFATLHYVAERRLSRGKIVVVDATNVQPEARRPLVELARAQNVLPVAIVLDVDDDVCIDRNSRRTDRSMPTGVVRRQARDLRSSLRGLAREGIRQVHVLGEAEIDSAEIERVPLWCDRRDERGPFDIIGDVHGCREELEELLGTLGYVRTDGAYAHPAGRTAIFLGDLVDRGPDSPGTVGIAMAMVDRESAIAVPGNHDVRLVRKLRGRDVKLTHGLAETMAQLEGQGPEAREEIAEFFDALVAHLVLDGGRLVVAHAGMKEAYQGRASGRVREFALYGETTGETDEYGLPVRANWAAQYRGRAAVAYGHTPVVEAEWVNGTICLDTGCCFGGKLTALRWPERELVSVKARRTYAEPIRPLAASSARTGQHEADDLLDVADVLARLRIETRHAGTVLIPEANVRAALEVTSRFCADPRWIVHLPPTMSPGAATDRPDLLEHPDEVLAYYRAAGVPRAICEEKHMGSRMIVVLARDGERAARRFGTSGQERGVCLSRTGRRFFGKKRELEERVLDGLDRAMTRSGLWDELETDWVVLDSELLPWSAKAEELLRDQYAQVGAASGAALADTVRALETAVPIATPEARSEIEALLADARRKAEHAARYVTAYRCYAGKPDELRVAPFHLLASEGRTHLDRDHLFHMDVARRLAEADPIVLATKHRVVELGSDRSRAEAVAFWDELTAAGGEGMVVKPLDFVVRGEKGLLQPAVKCRGREYLRIIYGPDYVDHLERLRERGLGRKRGLAIREFALGAEALERFVRKEPLRRVHECILGLVALESEPVDPRL